MPNCKCARKNLFWSRETLGKASAAALKLIGLSGAGVLALLAARFWQGHRRVRAGWPDVGA
jgi:hypothetical protein